MIVSVAASKPGRVVAETGDRGGWSLLGFIPRHLTSRHR